MQLQPICFWMGLCTQESRVIQLLGAGHKNYYCGSIETCLALTHFCSSIFLSNIKCDWYVILLHEPNHPHEVFRHTACTICFGEEGSWQMASGGGLAVS